MISQIEDVMMKPVTMLGAGPWRGMSLRLEVCIGFSWA